MGITGSRVAVIGGSIAGCSFTGGVYIGPPRPMTDPALIPPGQVPPDLMTVLHDVLTDSFPPLWADVIARTPAERISVQPIFDVTAPRYAGCRGAARWAPVLAGYDSARTAAGNALTALGRSLGRGLVESTPDWSAMSQADVTAWWRAAASDRTSLYE